MLEETKREVREMRALEAQMKWNMQREEKNGKLQETKEAEEEIRDWRWKQSMEMKSHAESKELETKIAELKESKSLQEFKREKKIEEKAMEQKYLQEMYDKDIEKASTRMEIKREEMEREHAYLAERYESQQHLKEALTAARVRAKAHEEEQQAAQLALEMEAQAKALTKERDAMMHNLELTRAAAKVAPGGRNARPSTSGSQRSWA